MAQPALQWSWKKFFTVYQKMRGRQLTAILYRAALFILRRGKGDIFTAVPFCILASKTINLLRIVLHQRHHLNFQYSV
jgi:hypothetical protein